MKPSDRARVRRIRDRLRAIYGRPIAPGTLMFSVKARPMAEQPAIVRTPTPGMPAPLNLRWIAAALGDVDYELSASLISETQSIDLVRERGVDGVELFRLPPHEGFCRPLCPGERYRIEVEGWETAAGPLGEIQTSTIPDQQPPEIIATKVVFRGGQPWVEICAREPILVKGEARIEGRAIAYQIVPVALEQGSKFAVREGGLTVGAGVITKIIK